MMLESYKHAKCAFVTLTYDDEHLPKGGTLVKKHHQQFLKNLRKKFPAGFIRFYVTGEYGEKNQRPHYHLALFGPGPENKQEIDQAWGRGDTHVGDLTHDSASYIAGYLTKKMNHPESKCTPQCKHAKLNGRLPEYSRMSLRPGIGATAVPDLVDALTTSAGCDALARVGDVPYELLLEKKSIPLGRYIRGLLREKMHFPDRKMPEEAANAYKAEMQKLLKDHVATKKETSLSKYIDKTQHYQNYLVDKNRQKVLQLEKKFKIYSAKKDKL